MPNVTVILDSCHSGSETRGGAEVRRVPDDERRPPAGAPRRRKAPTISGRKMRRTCSSPARAVPELANEVHQRSKEGLRTRQKRWLCPRDSKSIAGTYSDTIADEMLLWLHAGSAKDAESRPSCRIG